MASNFFPPPPLPTARTVEEALAQLQQALSNLAVVMLPFNIRVRWLVSVEGRAKWKRLGTLGDFDV